MPSALLQVDVLSGVGPWGRFLLLVAVAALAGYLAERVAIRSLRRLARATRTEIDDVIVHALHPSLVVAAVVASIWVGLETLSLPLPDRVLGWTFRAGVAVVLFVAALTLARLFAGFLRYRARRQPRWKAAATLGSRAASVVVYVTAFLITLRYYGLEITPLLTSLGLAGLAVALALQDTLSNFFAGVWMQTGRALRPGHFVRVEESQIEGYVDEIGWRTTKIRTLPNNLVVVPNARLAQSIITDYYLPEPRMSLLVPVQVGYEADPVHVERILVEEALAAAEETPGLLREPEPFVRLIPGFGDYALQFTLVCQVSEFTDQFLAQSELRKRILQRFRQEGIRIPYPVREAVSVPPDRRDVSRAAARKA